MNSSNPVLSRLAGRANRHAGLRRERAAYPGPGYAGGYGEVEEQGGYSPYPDAREGRMTVDDVVIRTVTLLGITGLVAALAWAFVPTTSGVRFGVLIGAGLTAMIAGLVISFKQVTNPFVISAFAALEGVFVGIFSKIYADAFGGGIVLTAAVATFAVFFGMALVYKFRIIRATPKFTKWIVGLMFGALAILMLNFALAMFNVNDGEGLGLRSGGPLAICVSLFLIGLASLSFILDFAMIEEGVKMGLPARYAWFCGFGILVGLVWLYLEILRLLGYVRD